MTIQYIHEMYILLLVLSVISGFLFQEVAIVMNLVENYDTCYNYSQLSIITGLLIFLVANTWVCMREYSREYYYNKW